MCSIIIPKYEWFVGQPWENKGNEYTGSIGAKSINNNAFNYKLNFLREENGAIFDAQVYDSIEQMDTEKSDYLSKTFEGTEKGREEMIEWLEFQYQEFLNEGKDKIKIHFSKKQW